MTPQASSDAITPAASCTRKLLIWSALIVAAHFVTILWHLQLLASIQPSFPRIAGVMLVLINLLPIAGVIAFAQGANRIAAILIVVPLATALVIGGHTHFLSAGSDNVLQLPSGRLTLPFQISAALLLVLEGLACWLGVQMFFLRRA